jgi:hypothetical protein
MIDTPQIPHNRTFLVFGLDLVVLCSDCAANKDRFAYSGVGPTIRPCDECGRTPSEVERGVKR